MSSNNDGLRKARPTKAAVSSLRRVLHALPDKLGPSDLAGFDREAAEIAARHGLLAVIGQARTPAAYLEREIEAELRKSQIGIAYQSERIRRAWEAALDVLSDCDVDALPLKGRSLALRLYEHPAARMCADVDILVRRRDFECALSAFVKSGYSIPSEIAARHYLKNHHHLILKSPKQLPPVELHFALSSDLGAGLDSGAIFDRALVQDVGGRLVRVMEPVDEFVYLAAHAATHAFLPLRNLLDLKLLASASRRRGVDGLNKPCPTLTQDRFEAEKRGCSGQALDAQVCCHGRDGATSNGLDAELIWKRACDGEVSVAIAIAVALAQHWTGMELELPVAMNTRMRLTRAIFPDVLLAQGFYSPSKHMLAAWVPRLVAMDRVSRAGLCFVSNLARGMRRIARRRMRGLVPAHWAE